MENQRREILQEADPTVCLIVPPLREWIEGADALTRLGLRGQSRPAAVRRCFDGGVSDVNDRRGSWMVHAGGKKTSGENWEKFKAESFRGMQNIAK